MSARRSIVSLLVALGLTTAVAFGATPVQLTFTVWSYSNDVILDNIKKFEAKNPGIKVAMQDFSWEKYTDVMTARFVGKTATDVAYSSDHWLQQWAAANWIVPLEEDIPPWYIEVFLSMAYSFKDYRMFDDSLNAVFDKDGSAAHKVAQWLADGMRKHKIINPASLETTEIPLVKAMGAGQVAFAVLPKYNLADLNTPGAHAQAGKFKMALMPGETHGTVGFVRFYAMTKMAADRGTDARDAAWKFLEYFGGRTDGQFTVVKRWALEKGLGFAQMPPSKDQQSRAG